MQRVMQESRDQRAHNYRMSNPYPYQDPSSSASSDGPGDIPPLYPDLRDLRDRRSAFYSDAR